MGKQTPSYPVLFHTDTILSLSRWAKTAFSPIRRVPRRLRLDRRKPPISISISGTLQHPGIQYNDADFCRVFPALQLMARRHGPAMMVIRSGALVFGVVRFLSFIWIIRFSLFTLCCSFRRLGELAVVLKTQNEIQSNHRKSRSLAKSIRLQTNVLVSRVGVRKIHKSLNGHSPSWNTSHF